MSKPKPTDFTFWIDDRGDGKGNPQKPPKNYTEIDDYPSCGNCAYLSDDSKWGTHDCMLWNPPHWNDFDVWSFICDGWRQHEAK